MLVGTLNGHTSRSLLQMHWFEIFCCEFFPHLQEVGGAFRRAKPVQNTPRGTAQVHITFGGLAVSDERSEPWIGPPFDLALISHTNCDAIAWNQNLVIHLHVFLNFSVFLLMLSDVDW